MKNYKHFVHKGNGTMEVCKVYLLDQANSATTTDLDPDAVANLLYQSRKDEGDLNFWWHSHVNMGVFWSGTDMDTIKQFGNNGYILATVFNKKKEMKSAFFHGTTDFLPAVFKDDLDTSIGDIVPQELIEIWDANLKEKSKKVVYNNPICNGFDKKGHTWRAGHLGDNDEWIYGGWVKDKKKEETKEVVKATMKDLNAMDYYEWTTAYGVIYNKDQADIEDHDLDNFYEEFEMDINLVNQELLSIAFEAGEYGNV